MMNDTPPDLTTALITALKADATVSALVGARIYRRGSLPTTTITLPYVVIYTTSDTADKQTADARVQCSCFAGSDPASSTLSKTIRNALHRTKNTLLPAGARKVWVTAIKDAGMTTDENSEILIYMEHRSFTINYDYR
jgi:hypothetical protein